MKKKTIPMGKMLMVVGLVFMFASSCKKNDGTNPLNLNIGQTFQGGIVAYILQPGDVGYNSSVQHGLIAAPTDQSTAIIWWNGSNMTTGATGVAIGTGKSNTTAIISAQGSGSYAASICTALTLGGYNDWYLPSKDELFELYANQSSIGGFANQGSYWSSTESSTSGAFNVYFVLGTTYNSFKYTTCYVRAVRSF